MSPSLNIRRFRSVLISGLTLGLAACGGGGGDGDASPAAAVPSSGAFAWLLKADGSTSNLRYGLSLVHPQAASVDYVVEPPSAAVTEARVVASGTVDAANARVSGLSPFALVYIVGGDVRRVPLLANGQAPATRVTRASTSSACRILLEAIDHAAPEQGRFVVSTAGSDGQCGSADDGRAEVKLDSSLGVVYTPLSADLPLGVLRDPATTAPRGWISARNAVLWSGTPSSFTLRAAGSAAIDRVIAGSHRSALVESSTGLSLLEFSAGAGFTDTALPGITAGGWESIGHDASAFYAYRNAGSGSTATWQVLKVARTPTVSTTLASGSGRIDIGSMGEALLYLSVQGTPANRLLTLGKATLAGPQVLETLGTTGIATVLTSNAGVHQLWRVTGIGTASIAYAIEMIDESFNKVHFAPAGGFPLAMAEAASIDFNRSENRSRFLYATGYGARAFGDSTLTAYDAAARTVTALGALPGTTAYGSDAVFANVSTSSSSSGAGFAGRSVNGSVQGAEARTFSFDLGTANSLSFTTTTR